jgi:hypothetical protein
MPEWFSAMLGSSAFIGAGALALREGSRALTKRNAATVARLNAETERMLAEVRVRDSQARITEEDATALRSALFGALDDLRATRERCDNVLQALEEERIGRARAEEQAHRIRADFAAYHVEVRAGRTPKITPISLARVDETQPFGVAR